MARKWTALQHTHQTILKRYRLLVVLFLVSFMVVVGLAHRVSAIVHHQSSSLPQTLIERSQAQLKNGDLAGAIQTQQTAVELLRQDPTQQENMAISLTNLGRLNLQAGHFKAATEQFTEADRLYAIAPVTDRHRLQNRGYQAQALRQLGQYQTACLKLVNTLWLDSPSDPGRSLCDTGTLDNATLPPLAPGIAQQSDAIQSQLLRELGITLRVLGHLEASVDSLSQFPFQQTDEATQLSLANTKRAQGNLIRDRLASPRYDTMPWRFESEVFSVTVVGRGGTPSDDYQAMQDYYQQAQEIYTQIEEPIERSSKQQHNSTLLNVKAQLNHLSLQLDQIALLSQNDAQYGPRVNAALQFAQTIDISQLPVGQAKIFAQITMARYQTFLNQLLDTEAIPWSQIQTLLDDAMEGAESLGNPHVLSYVLGNKGGLYEYFAGLESQETTTANQWRDRAALLTQAALVNAQPMDAPDIAYQWQWQLGRLARMDGDREGAIAHYKEAVNTLQAVRKDLLNIKADVRFSFRDNVEPVYRGLVDALLTNPSTQDIEAAVQTIDGLQLAELESFLRCRLDGAINVHQQLDEIDPKAAFIYPIILRDRLEVIAKLPGQPITHYSEAVAPEIIEDTLKRFRERVLSLGGGDQSNQPASDEQLYDWLLRPIEGAISNPETVVETMVFVPDSAFRNMAPTALYDREMNQYVVEKNYATVLLPNTQLFDLGKVRQKPTVLAIGIGDAQIIQDESFKPLEAEQEIETIQRIIPNTYPLLNEKANRLEIEDKLASISPSVLHFTSHGKFSSNPDETYIVIYENVLKSHELDNLLQSSPNYADGIDLLTLAACQSANGDNRAVLGLAGVAVNANARSTLASLWNIKDEVMLTFMESFYQEFSDPTVTKAEALHHAQQTIRKSPDEAPYFWAPFTLIGAWN